jgi:transcription antitermination factor NusG
VFETGEVVRITDGPFVSLTGIVQRSPGKRVEILREMLGRATILNIDALHLEKV